MISIARTFGAPLTVPAGKRRAQHVDGVAPFRELARDLAREVHDVRVALERHELLDLLRPEPHDPADVVAGQIDEHHVLGTLLRVLAELCRESPIVLLAPSAVAGPGDRSDDHASVEHLHHRLGRGADQRRLGVANDVHVGRRVHLAEDSIHVERVERALDVETLREDDLERVTGEDVLARDLDGIAVEAARHRRPHLGQVERLVGRRWRRNVGQRTRELVDELVERATARSYAAST